jgi:hypothetical protein
MKLLPKEEIKIEPSRDGVHIIASLYEHPDGYRWWDKYKTSDLPNDLISLHDLERFGINIINMETRSF